MKVDLSKPIEDFEGNPIQQNGSALTYGKLIRDILGSPAEKENGDKKLKKYQLGIKCVADAPDLSVDERKLIKDTADQVGLNPLVYGRICDLMENDES